MSGCRHSPRLRVRECHNLRMKSSVRLTVAVVLAVVAARGVQASASAYAVTPSVAQAKHATRLEVMTRYTVLKARAQPRQPATLNVGCSRLRQRLYRCSFFGATVAPPTSTSTSFMAGRWCALTSARTYASTTFLALGTTSRLPPRSTWAAERCLPAQETTSL